jgi:hypothetical protein
MKMPPGFEWIATLPPGLQFVIMLGVGLGLAAWGRGGFLSGRKEPPVSPKDVVLTAASITDMMPIKDAATALTRVALASEDGLKTLARIADELGTIRQILAEDAENRQDDRNYRRGLEAGRREPSTRRR